MFDFIMGTLLGAILNFGCCYYFYGKQLRKKYLAGFNEGWDTAEQTYKY